MGSFDAARRRIRRHASQARTAPPVAERSPNLLGIADWLSLDKLREALGTPAGSPYSWHVWVYTCVRVRATNLGQLPFGIFTGSAKKPRPVTDGPWVDLFRKPAPTIRGRELHVMAETYLCLHGEAFYVWAGPTGGDVAEGQVPTILQVFPGGQYAEPMRARDGQIAGWAWTIRGKRIEFPAYRVCHVRYLDPENPERGISPLAAAAVGIETDGLAARWNRAFFRNNATPSGALVGPANAPALDEDQANLQKRRWKDVHQGADKNHDIAILSGGVTFQQFSPTHTDMGFEGQRRWSRDEVAAAFQVPQFFLGLTTDLKYATARESRRILYENVLLPEAAMLQDCLEADLFHVQVPAEERARASLKGEKVIWGAFDGSTVDALRDSHDERLARMEKLIGMGYTRNEANAYLELGLPEIPEAEGGEARTVGFGLALLDEIANPEPLDLGLPPALPPKTNPPAGDPPGEKPKDGEDAPPPEAPRGHRCRGMDHGRRRRLAGWLQLVTHAYAPGERAFLSATRTHFRGIGQEILGLLTGDGRSLRTVRANPSELEWFLEQNRRAWDEALAALARPIYARAANAGVKILEHQVPKGFAVVQATNPKILRFLAEKELKLVNVNGTFLDGVRSTLVEGMAEQATVSELEVRLQREMEIQGGRAKNIARTETAGATNGTRTIAMQESEGIRGREWTTAGDDNVRETHVPLDGEVIPVTGTYEVGAATLRFPGDPDGPPEEICMCRCSEGPVLES